MDVFQKGNKRFKDTTEAHELVIEKHSKYSWTVTTLSGETEAWLKDTLGKAAINASRLPEGAGPKGGSSKSKNRSIKYVCPECGAIIRATKEVNVVCGDCDVAFEREEWGPENEKSASRE